MSDFRSINHATIHPFHNRASPRAEVSAEMLRVLAPWLAEAIKSPSAHPIEIAKELRHFAIRAEEVEGGLLVSVLTPAGAFTPGGPHTGPYEEILSFGVAKDRSSHARLWFSLCKKAEVNTLDIPALPWIGVVINPENLLRHASATHWLADFERCLAWAWIEIVSERN